MNRLALVIALIIFSSLCLSGCTQKEWTLMICKTKHFSGGCDDISYLLNGYKTQRECMEKGLALKNPEGFECGVNCKPWGSLQSCSEICNETGCSK